jgi:hypothetical protein
VWKSATFMSLSLIFSFTNIYRQIQLLIKSTLWHVIGRYSSIWNVKSIYRIKFHKKNFLMTESLSSLSVFFLYKKNYMTQPIIA